MLIVRKKKYYEIAFTYQIREKSAPEEVYIDAYDGKTDNGIRFWFGHNGSNLGSERSDKG